MGNLGVLEHLILDPGSVHSELLNKHLSSVGQFPSVNKVGMYRYVIPMVRVSQRREQMWSALHRACLAHCPQRVSLGGWGQVRQTVLSLYHPHSGH